jgi:uncharacterized protein with FMN-binding domain
MRRIILLAFLSIILTGHILYAGAVWFKDGTYEGECFFIRIAVTVAEGKISGIQILYHGNGGKQYELMILPLIDEMIEKQTTVVDSISGATISCINLRRAVNDALRDAVAGGRFDWDEEFE